MAVPPLMRTQAADRAQHCCEYCQLPQSLTILPFQPDHIIAEQHGGNTVLQNIAWACIHCNKKKGPNIASVDPETQQHSRLFNPRTDKWRDHFEWNGAVLQGTTPIGRATVRLLDINNPERVEVRAHLIDEGVFPLPATVD